MSKSKSDTQPTLADFESILEELERLVARMEQGDQSLEQSLKDFERGVGLTKTCQSILSKAEQKVDQLIKTQQGATEARPFTDPDD